MDIPTSFKIKILLLRFKAGKAGKHEEENLKC
jgi:hypothetical protein